MVWEETMIQLDAAKRPSRMRADTWPSSFSQDRLLLELNRSGLGEIVHSCIQLAAVMQWPEWEQMLEGWRWSQLSWGRNNRQFNTLFQWKGGAKWHTEWRAPRIIYLQETSYKLGHCWVLAGVEPKGQMWCPHTDAGFRDSTEGVCKDKRKCA